jgi:anti-anti-sigma factor
MIVERPMLDCAVRYEAGHPWLELRGRLDSMTAPRVQQQLSDLVARGERAVVVALQEVHYVSSAGLRVLLGTQKQLMAAGGELILFRMPDAVRSVFALGGLLSAFRRAATAEEVALLLRPPESEAAVVVREIHGATFRCLPCQASKGSLRAIGSPAPLARAQYGESDVVPVPATELAGGVGLAALGEGFDEYRGLFGESVAIRHHLFTYPAIPNPTADYLLCTRPEQPPTYKFLHGFGFQGACAHLVAFDSPDGRLDLGRLTEALFTLASADVLGLLFVAEASGVWGMHLKRIPLAANAPANGLEISAPENFPQWLHFPLEPEDAGHILAGAGLAVRDRQAVGPTIQGLLPDGLPFHLHAGVFARQPLTTKAAQFEAELARVLTELEPLKVYHLLGRTTVRNGLVGVIELDG